MTIRIIGAFHWLPQADAAFLTRTALVAHHAWPEMPPVLAYAP